MMTEPAKLESFYEQYKELKREHVAALKQWAEKQPHLPKFTEMEIARFLFSCYYNNEMAKQTIDNYATMRTHFPEVFANRNPEYIKDSAENTIVVLLPRRTPKGEHVVIQSLHDSDASKFNYCEFVKKVDMMTSIYNHYLGLSPGQHLIVNAAHYTIGHWSKIDITVMRKYALFVQKALPIRLKGIHIINSNIVVEKTLALCKPFIAKELYELIKVHRTFDTLYEYIPKTNLPAEYGGDAPSLIELHRNELKLLFANTELFKEEAKIRVDESKRPGKPKGSEIFGMEGTFKKLEID